MQRRFFGLYDVHGNVSEWCQDWYAPYESGHRAGDGALLGQPSEDGTRHRVIRGGRFLRPAIYARSALRYKHAPDFRYYDLSCRPAKAITAD